MHIVFICSEYPYSDQPTGGFGTYVKNISSALLKKRNNIIIICRGQKKQVIKENRLTIIVIPSAFSQFTGFFQSPSFTLLNRIGKFFSYPLGFSWAVRQEIRSLDKKMKIDVIEGGDFAGEMFCYLLLRRKESPKVIIRLHTPSYFIHTINREQKNIFYYVIKFIETYCLTKADALYSPTKALANIIGNQIHRKVGTIIRYPYSFEKNHKKIKRNGILYVGKLQTKKGVFILAAAIQTVLEKYPALRFYFIGPDTKENDFSVRSRLRDYFIKNGCSRSVKLIEQISQKELLHFYQKSLMIVVPSLWENFPNVLFEATANGCALIATKTGGIPEILRNKQDGLLVQPLSSDKLAKAIFLLLENSKMRYEFHKNAFEHFDRKLNPKLIAEQTLNFYTKMLKKDLN